MPRQKKARCYEFIVYERGVLSDDEIRLIVELIVGEVLRLLTKAARDGGESEIS
jgi:hypothetical protein